jgi:hypothetical protein
MRAGVIARWVLAAAAAVVPAVAFAADAVASLAAAAKKQDAAAVRTLLRQRADVNAADATMTWLRCAPCWPPAPRPARPIVMG